MADAHGSGPCVRKDVGVQLPPCPPCEVSIHPELVNPVFRHLTLRSSPTLPRAEQLRSLVCVTPQDYSDRLVRFGLLGQKSSLGLSAAAGSGPAWTSPQCGNCSAMSASRGTSITAAARKKRSGSAIDTVNYRRRSHPTRASSRTSQTLRPVVRDFGLRPGPSHGTSPMNLRYCDAGDHEPASDSLVGFRRRFNS
jgi:hypothetical protein